MATFKNTLSTVTKTTVDIGISKKSAAAVILRARKSAYLQRRFFYLDLGTVLF